MPIRVEALEDFRGLETWWNAQEGPSTSVFLRTEWFELVAKARAEPMMILVAYKRDTPVAGLALASRGRTLHSLVDYSSEVFDVVSDGSGRGLADLLAVATRRHGFVDLHLLPEHSLLLGMKSARWQELQRRSSALIHMPPSEEELMAGLGKKLRSNLRRGFRHLQSIGRVDVVLGPTGSAAEVLFEDGLKLEAAGWKGRAGSAVLCAPERERFYRELFELATSRGWLRLGGMYLDGGLVAFNFDLEYSDRLFSLLTAYDEELPPRCSPGQVLLWRTLEDATRRGIRTFELGGVGQDTGWKGTWTDQYAERAYLRVFGSGVSGVAYETAWRARSRWRAFRSKDA